MQDNFQAGERTDELFAGDEQGDGPFQPQRWSCLPFDSILVCAGVRDGCDHLRLRHNPVIHQTKDRAHQNIVRSASNNRMANLCPSS